MKEVRRYILEQVASGSLDKEKAAKMLMELYDYVLSEDNVKEEISISETEDLDKSNHSDFEDIIKDSQEKEYYPMLPSQKMILLHQFMKRDTAYNIPRVLFLEGDVDEEKINDTFKTIVERHHALRTSFHLHHGEYMQKINEVSDFSIESVEGDEKNIEDDIRSFVRSFQLDKAPLFRVRLIKYDSKKYVLLMDIHHIISDRKSIVVLMNEFQQLYQGIEPVKTEVHYEHYVELYNNFLNSDIGISKEKYWLEQFDDGKMSTELKIDFSKEGIRKYTEKSLYHEFQDDYRDKLLQFCSSNGVTLNMLMLSVYHVLLWKWLGKDDLVTGLSCQGRTIKEAYNMIGMFVNTLAIRNYPSGEKKYFDFLNETKEILLNAYSNQEYPFDVLTDKIRQKSKIKDKSLINTLFIMQNTDYGELELGDIRVKPYHDYIETDGRFDLQINIFNSSEKHLNICFIYSKELFKEETIKTLLNEYISILKQVVEEPEKLLNNLDINL